jgi:hypothetical protein
LVFPAATLPRLWLLGLAQLPPPRHGDYHPGGPGSSPQTAVRSPRRGAGGGAPLLCPFMPLLLSRQWNRGKGKTPSGWWGVNRGLASGCRRPVTGGAGAKMPQRAGIGCAGEEGDVAALHCSEELLMSWFQGQRNPFPHGGFSRRVRMRSDSTSGPVRRCGRPIGRAHSTTGPAHIGAEEEKGEGRGIRRLIGGAKLSAIEEKKRGRWLLGCCAAQLGWP